MIASFSFHPGRSAKRRGARARRIAGFTLTELAVVLAIVGLLLGGLLYTLSAQVEQRNREETQRKLDEARELLLAFAIVNRRLPCPASTASNGDESPAGGGMCTDSRTGFLPAVAIGFQPVDGSGYALDSWGNRIRYAVSDTLYTAPGGGCPAPTLPHFTSSANLKANGLACRPNDIVICAAWGGSTVDCGTAQQVTNQSPGNRVVAAVIWSQGKNFAIAGAGGSDEAANDKVGGPPPQNNHPVFVTHSAAPAGAAGGEFDDMLVWIPVGLLYSRMIAAGVLP